jgi:hypothetical protein
MIVGQAGIEVSTLHSISAGLAVVNLGIKFPLLRATTVLVCFVLIAAQIVTVDVKTVILAK